MEKRGRYSVCAAHELTPGRLKLVEVNGVEIGVTRVGDRVVAYRNVCPHQGAPVCRGRVGGTTLPSAPGEYVYGKQGQVLHCPWHGWQFDLATGMALSHAQRLATVPAEVDEGMVSVYI
ncbi:MAG: Rieske (2Fe-2S) protein [Acidobacteria bacterium]|nr:Rieske (2Fe-2S) protein [Acidobacteriota bacterium]MCI0717601.1 Rieske (2Fe-2S) protein [Acidobacteriota bacterium]